MRQTLLLVAVLSVGCRDGVAPHSNLVDIRGTWAAPSTVAGSGLVLNITQGDSVVAGTGVYAIEAGPSGTLQVSGVYAWPRLTLSLHYDTGRRETYAAILLDSRLMSGALIDSVGHRYDVAFGRE